MAKEGKFKISLPWLNIKKQVPDSHGHPITGSAEHYVLNDKFHEDNSKDQRDARRKIGLVAQLAGKVNSQVVEQFFSKLKKNNYFLNMTLPSTHIFLMRSIIHHHDSQKNLKRLEAFKRVFGTEVVLNINHQAVIATLDMSETSTQPHVSEDQLTNISGSEATVDVPPLPESVPPLTGIASAEGIMQDFMILEDADENSTQPWKKPHNPLQDKLLRYILDTRRLADEVIVKEGATCLTRADFWTLGLRRDMESDIGNACMKIIYEDARAHGKDIYIADLYLVPTWKTDKDPLAYLPSDADMKDALVFPAWTQAAGPDHYVLCVLKPLLREILLLDSLYSNHESGFGDDQYRDIFRSIAHRLDPGQWTEVTGLDIGAFPQQSNIHDCGIFMLMYALYTVLNTRFSFTQLDMPVIREWWCLRLIERFETEGYGKRFAHWNEDARCLTEGTLQPLYRDFPGLTYDLPQHVVERNRKSCNQPLVDFIVATRGTDNHIQSIINGQKKSKWLEMFSNPSAKTMLVPVYLEDQDQIDDVYIHLTSVLDRRPTHTHSDTVKFVMDVLFPESIIYALAALENVTMLEAENKFLRGPVIDISEREQFDRRIGHFLKKSGNPWES
ncbi:uncharacterized protein LOC130407827 isoform X2 [Triplophysa dalaica]|uniref:uncharacterized protein LOC130407827 isoform X2 n=1 Tax=Triplophysa dalaica TaxID=1582913 RepID=UPI0024E01DE7|nr:uncharacterized protein LOC130407827 isoform X2 [Triplophysa dalaica]